MAFRRCVKRCPGGRTAPTAIDLSVCTRRACARGATGETACFQPDGGDGNGHTAYRQVLECGESNAWHRFGGPGWTFALELVGWRSGGQGLDFVAPGVWSRPAGGPVRGVSSGRTSSKAVQRFATPHSKTLAREGRPPRRRILGGWSQLPPRCELRQAKISEVNRSGTDRSPTPRVSGPVGWVRRTVESRGPDDRGLSKSGDRPWTSLGSRPI